MSLFFKDNLLRMGPNRFSHELIEISKDFVRATFEAIQDESDLGILDLNLETLTESEFINYSNRHHGTFNFVDAYRWEVIKQYSTPNYPASFKDVFPEYLKDIAECIVFPKEK